MGSLPVGYDQNITRTKYWSEKTKTKKIFKYKKVFSKFYKKRFIKHNLKLNYKFFVNKVYFCKRVFD